MSSRHNKLTKVSLLIVAGLLVGACTTAPAPTPEVITKTVEVPGPTVYVVPQVCFDAIDLLIENASADAEIIIYYLQGEEPPLSSFERSLDIDDIKKMFDMAKECYGYEIYGIQN